MQSHFHVILSEIAGDNVRVQEGFEACLDSVWPEVQAELAKLTVRSSTPVTVSAPPSPRSRPRGVPLERTIPPGHRGWETRSLRRAWDPRLYRVVDDEETVTLVPPQELGFRHAGELHRIGPRSRSGSRARALRWLQSLVGPPKPLADHAPINYVERVLPWISWIEFGPQRRPHCRRRAWTASSASLTLHFDQAGQGTLILGARTCSP